MRTVSVPFNKINHPLKSYHGYIHTSLYPSVPGAPASVTVLPYPTYLELSWSPPYEPNGVIVSYEVRWCDTGTVPTRALGCYSDVVNTTTEYRVEGLVPGKCYNVTVAANTSVGQGPPLQGFEDGVSKDPCTKAGR